MALENWFTYLVKNILDYNAPSVAQVIITPDDDNDIAGGPVRALLLSDDAVVSLVNAKGVTVQLPLQKGYNPIAAQRIMNTGTSLGSEILVGLR